MPTSICRLFFLTSQPNRIGTIGPCHAAVLLFPNHSCISPVYKVITKCLMHHRAPGKFRESIIARRLELKWFTTVMHHLGNVLLQKNSFLLPVCCWKNNLSLCRRGELLNFLTYKNGPKKLHKSFRWIFLPSFNSKEQIFGFLLLFSLLFSSAPFPCLVLQILCHQMAGELVGASSCGLKEEVQCSNTFSFIGGS